MERKHKIYFIISGIAYLLLCSTFKIPYIFEYPLLAYQVYIYSQLFILVLAFIFGIRNSICAVILWLGIIFGDFIYHTNDAILNIYSLELGGIINVFYFSLIIVAIVFGFKSLNMNTIDSGNFSKMYKKPAIVFLVCSIIYHALMSISVMEFFWFYKDNISEKSLYMFNYSVRLIIVISALGIAILKIVKRKTFGFVFTAVLLVWHFFFYISLFFPGSMLSYPALFFKKYAIKSSPILCLAPLIQLKFGPFIFVILFVFSIILLINFMFNLKRDSGLITTRSDENSKGER